MTSEARPDEYEALADELTSAANIVTVGGCYEVDTDAVARRLREAFEAKLAEVRAERDRLKEEVEERDEWAQIVDTTPLDEFDKQGDLWIRRMVIARMVNAIASVFSKWANEGIMARFREQMHILMHQAYVEGCMAGVKNERARSADRDRTIANFKDTITLQNKQTEDLLRDWETQRQKHLLTIADLEAKLESRNLLLGNRERTIAEQAAEIERLREALAEISNLSGEITPSRYTRLRNVSPTDP